MLLQLLAVALVISTMGSDMGVGVQGALPYDTQRPQYHFMPPDNYMNDPNGLMYFNGLYHMFYQYNNNTWAGGAKLWGHAVSKDLVYWQHLPIAMVNDQDYDIDGVWSGSATVVNGVPTLFYTGINNQSYQTGESQNMAIPADLSDPFLVKWIKNPLNPILSDLPPITPYSGFRDPSTGWRSNGKWYMIVGSGFPDVEGVSLLYSSPNYQNWTYVHPLFTAPNAHFMGDMFECSDFFQLGGSWVFKASIMTQGDMWVTGDWDSVAEVFTPYYNVEGRIDYGTFYASKTFHDTKLNRRIVFGFVQEDDQGDAVNKRGWANLQSLPRQITINLDDSLSINPIDDLQKLRSTHYNFPYQKVLDGQLLPLAVEGLQMEIELDVISAAPDATFGLRVRADEEGKEYTDIMFIPGDTQYNSDLPGNDYAAHSLSTSDYRKCESLCNQNGRCYGWTFSAPDDVSQFSSCNLKNWAGSFSTGNKNKVSGAKSMLYVNRINSSITVPAGYLTPQAAPLAVAGYKLRVFLDHSAIEIYANDGAAALISRIYPSLAGSQGLYLFSNGGDVTVTVNAWHMNSIWQ